MAWSRHVLYLLAALASPSRVSEWQHEVTAGGGPVVHVSDEDKGLWFCRNSGPGTGEVAEAHALEARSCSALLSKRGVE